MVRSTEHKGQEIVCDPAVMLGKPVVRGTRITVELIVEKLRAGESREQVLAAHPRLTESGIQAAMAYAAGTHGNPSGDSRA